MNQEKVRLCNFQNYIASRFTRISLVAPLFSLSRPQTETSVNAPTTENSYPQA